MIRGDGLALDSRWDKNFGVRTRRFKVQVFREGGSEFRWKCRVATSRNCYRDKEGQKDDATPGSDWVAVKELSFSYYIGETILIKNYCVYIYPLW